MAARGRHRAGPIRDGELDARAVAGCVSAWACITTPQVDSTDPFAWSGQMAMPRKLCCRPGLDAQSQSPASFDHTSNTARAPLVLSAVPHYACCGLTLSLQGPTSRAHSW